MSKGRLARFGCWAGHHIIWDPWLVWQITLIRHHHVSWFDTIWDWKRIRLVRDLNWVVMARYLSVLWWLDKVLLLRYIEVALGKVNGIWIIVHLNFFDIRMQNTLK